MKMARRISKSLQSLMELIYLSGLEPMVVYGRAKALLSIYRQMCWLCTNNVKENVCEIKELANGDFDTALAFLISFAPKMKRQHVQDNLFVLFQNREMLRLCDLALKEVEAFPERGNEYKRILLKVYVGKIKYSEQGILEMLDLERSVYYDRKREAIYAFGLAMWGKILPEIRI